ncbi:MAG: nucleotidyltransferase family protein [Bacteroidales bacterium]|nr:nucleotidyltransferase family protein [Bacteroidales bacterium]MDD2425569.1 nucleotidyltransferase family protein [Bacteroidales bacterium]MDD3989425.1 nucleotidyltransferase family protein [Bacteroidales bacterium]MDD4638259.1 nucleotidyltransferase family protein [Bacteroidales bacterium]
MIEEWINNGKDRNLLTLIGRIAGSKGASPRDLHNLKDGKGWTELMETAAAHGVLALAKDLLTEQEWREVPKEVRIKWQLSVDEIEERYFKQVEVYNALKDIFESNGIKVQLLKGIKLSEYYPVPCHRECGDIDIFIFDDYEKGNRLIESKGKKVDRTGHKHSKFNFKGVTIENHKSLLNVVTNRYDRILEPELRKMVENSETQAEFHLLFNIRHIIVHLISSGIVLRHLTDLYLFLKKEMEKIDFVKVFDILKKSRQYKIFAQLLYFISECFGDREIVSLVKGTPRADKIIEKLYEDTFHNISKRVATEDLLTMPVYRRKLIGARAVIRSKWKYDLIRRGYFCKDFIIRTGYAFGINRQKSK